jgi:hypothetical protein
LPVRPIAGSFAGVTIAASSSARRLCAMLGILLALLFAAVQGANALNHIQHAIMAMPHEHVLLGTVTMEQIDGVADAHAEAPDADPDMEGPLPVHHHHHSDHGPSLAAPFSGQDLMVVVSPQRLNIPHVPIVMGTTIEGLERPPKSQAFAA